jgi:hypothetical protein
MNFPSRSAVSISLYLIGAGFLVLLAGALTEAWVLRSVALALWAVRGVASKAPAIPDYTAIVIGAAVSALIGLAVILTGFFLGAARARRAAEEAGLTGYSHGLGWTMASFFVPFLNFYRPWVGLGEIRRSIFVAADDGETGRKWNRFGDVSTATIGLAVIVLGMSMGAIVYNLLASTPTPHSAAAAFAQLDHHRDRVLVTLAFITIEVMALFAYLATLGSKLRDLTRLAAERDAVRPR